MSCTYSNKLLKPIVSKLYYKFVPPLAQRFVAGALLKRHDHPSIRFKERILKFAKQGDIVSIKKVVESDYSFPLLTDKKRLILEQADSFVYYANFDKKQTKEPLYLAWWSEPEPGNMGDWLSPYVINKITGRNIYFVNLESKVIDESHCFSTGSIGKFAKNNSIVLGTGISARDAELNPRSKYLFVRGPLTRARVIECGGVCPEVYGDPACTMPLLYQPNEEVKSLKKDKYLLIRHFTHNSLNLSLPDNFDELSILVSTPHKIESFIDSLHQYKAIITSAMHCFILCQAYGIPCVLVTFSELKNAVHGDGIKYSDYMLGVGVPVQDVYILPSDLRSFDVDSIVSKNTISHEKMKSLIQIIKTELG